VDDAGNVVGLAKPPQGHGATPRLADRLVIGIGAGEGGADQPGSDGVDADPELAPLAGELLGQ
jgi:hypothetical protein